MFSMSTLALVIVALGCSLPPPGAARVVQSLSGADWFVSSGGEYKNISAHVPGSIYTDLRRANILTEGFYRNDNDRAYRWVSYLDWTYTKTFDVQPALLDKKSIVLTCHGLDTVGMVFLNNVLIGVVDNSFVRYRFDVKRVLRAKNNKLRIKFRSAPAEAKRRFEAVKAQVGYDIPPDCDPRQYSGECHFNMLRKMQASFSWDWGPAFPTQGIWKEIELEAFDHFLLEDITVDIRPLSSDHNRWSLSATLWLDGVAYSAHGSEIKVELDSKLIHNQSTQIHFSEYGTTEVKVHYETTEPVISWDVHNPHLYPLSVQVTSKDDNKTEVLNKTIKIGFRDIQLIQRQLLNISDAYTFYFQLNGRPLFAKGSNWIPAHVLHELQSKNYTRQLLVAAKEANMNMLRVWGGGIYEDDDFYETADELGILIWHDFMFACATYPAVDSFLDTVRQEVAQQVRRLQHHPSIAIWTSNNENEAVVVQHWFWKRGTNDTHYREDYQRLYVDTVKSVAKGLDPGRPFALSSPTSGVVSERAKYSLAHNPQSELNGDFHHYKYQGDLWDYHHSPSGKFASEYGAQSASYRLALVIDAENYTYPLSEVLEARNHQPGGNNYNRNLVSRQLPVERVKTMDEFVYLTQIFQAVAIRMETDFYRRNRELTNNGHGMTMGALYWQLNDIWPTVSWSSLEFGGQWKMMHYYAREMFKDLIVTAYVDGGHLKVAVVHDFGELPKSVELEVQLFHWASFKPAFTQRLPNLKIKKGDVTHVFDQSLHKLLSDHRCSKETCFVRAQLIDDKKKVIDSNDLVLASIKEHSGLTPVDIEIAKVEGNAAKDKYEISLTSSKLAAFVWLYFDLHVDDIQGVFTQNGFIMTANQMQLEFRPQTANVTVERIQKALKTRVLNDFF